MTKPCVVPMPAKGTCPGLTQAIGGLVIGLIALFCSYDHISIAGTARSRLQLSEAVALLIEQLQVGDRTGVSLRTSAMRLTRLTRWGIELVSCL